MPTLAEYATQSEFSSPGRFAGLLRELPADTAAVGAAARNLVVHYRSPTLELADERRGEIDCRWVARILEVDQARHPGSLTVPRGWSERVAGCCRDFTLLTVAGLREHGIPARSRIGFATYFMPGYHMDHVVTEWWNGERWVRTDTQLDASWNDFDATDMAWGPGSPFVTAAEAWTAIRSGAAEPSNYGVFPGSDIGGTWFVRDYVLRELAHRQRVELLLWDSLGYASVLTDDGPPDDVMPEVDELADRIAALLIAADGAHAAAAEEAEAELARIYAADDRIDPGGRIIQTSPYGLPDVEVSRRRE